LGLVWGVVWVLVGGGFCRWGGGGGVVLGGGGGGGGGAVLD